MKHALTMNIDPYTRVHYKDTTAAWQEQYMKSMPVDFPLVTPDDYDHALIDPDLHYPPIPTPKVGRPKKTGWIKSVKESTCKRALKEGVCVNQYAVIGLFTSTLALAHTHAHARCCIRNLAHSTNWSYGTPVYVTPSCVFGPIRLAERVFGPI